MKNIAHISAGKFGVSAVNTSSAVNWSNDIAQVTGIFVRSRLKAWAEYYWPLLILVVSIALLAKIWVDNSKLHTQNTILSIANNDLTGAAIRQSQGAFDSGDFRKASYYLRPVPYSEFEDTNLQLLRARIYECSGEFSNAAAAYHRIVLKGGAPKEILMAYDFCRRMSTERNATVQLSRPVLYRLHQELMKRGEVAQARYIALELRPDMRPLRESVGELLRQEDGNAEIVAAQDGASVDVKLAALTPGMTGLLRDLDIRSLSAEDTGISSVVPLGNLEMESLDLRRNPVGDVAPLRSMPLRALNLADTRVTDISSLAGMPLHELDISHTNVSSVEPLALCPLETLNLASLPVRDITPLRGLMLRDLNLSHTKVEDISSLSHLPLTTLNLDGTNVRDLTPLAGCKLRDLSLSGTPVTDITPLAGMPLVKLNLRGCNKITDLTPLEKCTSLEKLYLPKEVHLPPSLLHLPRLKIITH